MIFIKKKGFCIVDIVDIIIMLPKRKLIRKQHKRPQPEQDNQQSTPTSLIDRLKSLDQQPKQQALAFISSLCKFQQGNNQLVILTELLLILYQGNQTMVHSCLCALANLCEVAEWVTQRLFLLGLDKALIQLNSSDKNLVKPIMLLLMAVSKSIPEEYRYLIAGVQGSLTVQHFEQCSELVLEFLVATEARKIKEDLKAKIYDIFVKSQKFKVRSLALTALCNISELHSETPFLQAFFSYCEEVVADLNLESEYKNNIAHNKPISSKSSNNETQLMQQEEQIPTIHPNFEIFNDAVEGIEMLLDLILKIMEGQDWSDESEGEEDIMEEKSIGAGTLFQQELGKYLIANYQNLAKNTAVTFPQGENISNLALRLVAFMVSMKVPLENSSLVALRAIEQLISNDYHDELASEISTSALFILMKSNLPQEGRKTLINIGLKLKLKEQFKNSWIMLLELYSQHFNPEKNAVLAEENRFVGQILRNLIINVPFLQLEQWRAQTIDTLFDVYSNEQFDGVFVELGFVNLLQMVLQNVNASKSKKNKRSDREKDKFIKEVITDINRFLAYKKEQIKF